MSTDPIVQLPEVSQNWNPYTYIMNNPFSAVDPSGYSFVESVKDSVAGVGDFLEANLPSSGDAKLMVTGWAVGGPVGIAVAGGVLFAKTTVGGAIDTANATVDAFQREGLAGALYEVNERLNPVVGMLEHGSEFLNAAKTGDVRTAVREGLETTKHAVATIAAAGALKDRLVGSASGQRAGKGSTAAGGDAGGGGATATNKTPREALTDQLGRKPTKRELANYENELTQEAARSESTTRADQAGGALRGGHDSGARRSTKAKHEAGDARRKRDQGGEKGDARRRY